MRLLLEGEDENEPPAELVISDVAELDTVQEAVRRALSIEPSNPIQVPLKFYEPVSGSWHRLVNVQQLPQREGLPVKLWCGMSAKPREFPKPRLVVLGRDSHEFQMVQQEFEYMSSDASSFAVTCIERVENGGLEALFEAQVASLKHPAARLKLLYSPPLLPGIGGRGMVTEICRKGFSRSNWRNGDFGSGVYFLSGQVTKGQILAAEAVDPKIILCEVAVGAVMNVPAGLGSKEASFRDLDLESVRRAGFDSLRVFDSDDLTSELTSADPRDQDTHIIYHPFQALPRYVVSLRHTASAQSEASRPSPGRASRNGKLSPPTSAGGHLHSPWGGEDGMEELRRARALENKAEAASVLAREARARAARLDAVVREAHAAAAAVNTARERQEKDLERVVRDASRAGDAASLLEEHLANIHDSIRRDRAMSLRKQTIAEAMALVHRSMLCSRELTQALPSLDAAREDVMSSSTELLVALDDEEAKLMSALRATWAHYRNLIRSEVTAKTDAIDAYKSRLDDLVSTLSKSQAGVHTQKAAVRDEVSSEQDLLRDVSELHEHEDRLKEAMAAAQSVLAAPPEPFSQQLQVDATFHTVLPQLLARCIRLQGHASASDASRGSKQLGAGSVGQGMQNEGHTGEEDSPALTSELARILFDGPASLDSEQPAEGTWSVTKASGGGVERTRSEDAVLPQAQDLTRLPAEINRLTSSLRSAQLAASAYVMASGGGKVDKAGSYSGNGGGDTARYSSPQTRGGAAAGGDVEQVHEHDAKDESVSLLHPSASAQAEAGAEDIGAEVDMQHASAEDEVEPEVEAMTEQVLFEPDGGEYFNVLQVDLSSATPGAEIFFSITPQGDMSALESNPQCAEGVLQRATGPITFRNDRQGSAVKFQISAMAYARDLKASAIALSRPFTLTGMQTLEWDVQTATNGLAAFGGIQGCRLENKTGHAISRVRAKSPLPSVGRCWWEVVVERGVPDGNIAASGVGVCVGLVFVPENDRKREQWQTEQLGGNFSWCFNMSRGWIVHKGERKAYGRKAILPNQRIGIHIYRPEHTAGTISFSIDGVDMGIAYTGVPPCDLFPVVNIPLKGCVLHSEPYVRGSL